MILNLILGFVVPWLISLIHLYRKDKTLLLLVGSFFSVVSYTINTLASYFGFWEVFPFPNPRNLATLPFDLGAFPILACYMIYFIRKFKKPYLILFSMTLITTFLELIFVFFEWVIYGNGWNLFLTFFSYFFTYLLVYGHYNYLLKLKLIQEIK